MKATILLGTLKTDGLSNTETLCGFLSGKLQNAGVDCETIRLVDHDILPGTCSDMGTGDEWPGILDRLFRSEIMILATPIWWNNHSSLIQRVVERLDEIHDEVLAGNSSPLDGRVGGIVITGDSDGAQTIIGSLCNFLNGIGVVVPPYATLSVLWERQSKGSDRTRDELLHKFEADYTETAEKMVRQLVSFARG